MGNGGEVLCFYFLFLRSELLGGAKDVVDHALPQVLEHGRGLLRLLLGLLGGLLLVEEAEVDAVDALDVGHGVDPAGVDSDDLGHGNQRRLGGAGGDIGGAELTGGGVVVRHQGHAGAGLGGGGGGLAHEGQDGRVEVRRGDGGDGGGVGVEGLHEGLVAVGDGGLGRGTVGGGHAAGGLSGSC